MSDILDNVNGLSLWLELLKIMQVTKDPYLADLVASEVSIEFSMSNLDWGDIVAMQIKHLQLKQNVNILDFADLVLRKQKHLQVYQNA